MTKIGSRYWTPNQCARMGMLGLSGSWNPSEHGEHQNSCAGRLDTSGPGVTCKL